MASTAEVSKNYFYWRGALSILAGLLVLVWPGLTVLTLVTLISLWLLLVGIVSVVEGVMSIGRGGMHWLISILIGLFELGVGAYLVQRPGVTTLTIITLLGLVFVVQGFGMFLRTFLEKGVSGGRRMLSLIFGVLSIVAGIWIWRYPYHGTMAFVWLLGLYAMASGALLVAMGAELKE